jgi:hypothetical protein
VKVSATRRQAGGSLLAGPPTLWCHQIGVAWGAGIKTLNSPLTTPPGEINTYFLVGGIFDRPPWERPWPPAFPGGPPL